MTWTFLIVAVLSCSLGIFIGFVLSALLRANDEPSRPSLGESDG